MPPGRVGAWCSRSGDEGAVSFVGSALSLDVGEGQGGARGQKFWQPSHVL